MSTNPNSPLLNTSQASKNLIDSMKQSFEFWHQTFEDSPVNIQLIWKKALESNSDIAKQIEVEFGRQMEQATDFQIEYFLEWWGVAIKQSNFEVVRKFIQEWGEFWNHTTDEQFKIYSNVLKMLETYWRNIQDKNIE